MSALSPMLAAWYGSSPEPTSNHQASEYGGGVSGNYPASAVAAAVAAAAAAAAVSNSGSSATSASGSGGLALANASGMSAMHQATSLTSNYHSSVMSSMGYSDRAYENQMSGHCQTNSYSAYQPPPSPYRPHPVSPPAHHQSPYGGTPGAGQMHLPAISYSAGHQLSPYSSAQSHYGPSALSNQDVYSGRSPPIYGGSPNAHLLQQSMKPPSSGTSSPWAHHPSHDSSNNGDIMYQGQSSASRSSHLGGSTPSSPMPPPPLRSPPVSMSTPVGHYHRQMPPTNSSPSHSPHTWPQTGQIPSPSGGMLHSPRTTPSPLPNHGRSPGHAPFSPPPTSATPSPHHHHVSPMVGVSSSPMSQQHHQQQQQSCKTPPTSSSSSPPPSQNVSAMGSPAQNSGMGGGPSDPLQSLQKMVMLDSEMVSAEASAAVARGQYEINQGHAQHPHPHPPPPPPTHQTHHHQHHHPGANRPLSYFSSVENLAGNDPGSPYPTYYNLDQNRLCTPPRAGVSTPTSSTFTSAQDSASNSSVSVESYPVVVDSGHQINGGMVAQQQQQQQQQQQHQQRVDCNPRGSASIEASRSGMDGSDSMVDCGMSNGNSNEMVGSYDISGYGGKKKYAKGPGRGRRRSPSEFGINPGDKDSMMYGPMSARKPYPGNDGTNGQMDYYPDDRVHLGVVRKRGRGSRFAPGTPRWGGRMLVGEGDNELGGASAAAEEVSGVCSLDEGGMYLSLALKRGQRKKRTVTSPGGIQPPVGENMIEDPRYNDPSLGMGRPPRARAMRSPRGSGRRSRRRAGGSFSHFVNERPFDGGFLDSSGNATDGLRETGYLGNNNLDPAGMIPPIRDPSLIGATDEEIVPEGPTPFLKSGMLETPRNIPAAPPATQDLQFNARNPQVPGPPPPSHMQESFALSSRGDDYYSQQSFQGEATPGMPMPNVSYTGQPQVERKRGRPRGSKNKPKPPGEESSPKKSSSQQGTPNKGAGTAAVKKLEEQINSEVETPFVTKKFKGRTFLGPVIRLTGTREKPLSVEVVNYAVSDEIKETNKVAKQKRPVQAPLSSMGSSVLVRKKLGVLGHSSTLSPLYDAFTRDRSWVCSLCHKGSHYRGMGDLFGPYFSSEDQQRMAEAASTATPTGPYSSGVPTPTSIPENDESNKVWDQSTHLPVTSNVVSQPVQYGNSPVGRQIRAKRKRSDASEDCLKSTLLKRAKQGKKSSSILGIAASTASTASSLDGIPMGETECNSSISMAASSLMPNIDQSHNGLEYWVHEDCAIWSQGVYLVRQQVRGLDEAVKEAAEMICCKCKLNGATVGCFSKGCSEQYHVVCAKDRGCEMDEINYSMLCPKHKQYKTKMEIKQEDCGLSACSTPVSSTVTSKNAC